MRHGPQWRWKGHSNRSRTFYQQFINEHYLINASACEGTLDIIEDVLMLRACSATSVRKIRTLRDKTAYVNKM
jgi:hypothetical protein